MNKFMDAANIIKAKLKNDELQENLVQVTTEENWQAPTNMLHDIANAAYNYEKWQRINDFIWEKLKKKNTWRKILKTLNLVEFLLKNGPPNIVTAFKYDIYQFRSFNDYSYYSENIDRGEAIREKAKAIVDLLSNDDLLEEEREKAKVIRERMSGVSGGTYGSYSNSDTRESGRNNGYGGGHGNGYVGSGSGSNKYSGGNISGTSYGDGGIVGSTYGGYSETKSTLDKYKTPGGAKKAADSKPIANILPSSTGSNNVEEKVEAQTKKPFQKEVRKLSKPGERPQSIVPTEKKEEKPAVVQPPVQSGGGLLDDDFFGVSSPQSQPTQEVSYVNGMYSTTAQLAANHAQNENNKPQPQVQPQPQPQQMQQQQQQQPQQMQQPQQPQQPQQQQQMLNGNYQWNQQQQQQIYGQSMPQNMSNQHQMPSNNQFNPNPMYGQPNTYINPMYGQTAPMAAQNIQMTQQPQFNPVYNQTGPTVPQKSQPISLSQKEDEDFGGFQSGQSNKHENVKWLSQQEKGLIDFSDMGMSNSEGKAKKQEGNKINLDTWGW